ncbi:hypothetical protein [Tardiphaga sp.]|nr:hypothetical protein [Tardiphaga sp.]
MSLRACGLRAGGVRKVTANDENKGHRFVELNALIVADGTPCWHIATTS